MYLISYLVVFYIVLFSCIEICHNKLLPNNSVCRTSDLMSRRNKRFIVFPKQSTITVTATMNKAFLGGFPPGIFLIYELDQYFSLPDSIENWKPHTTSKYEYQLNQIPKPAPAKEYTYKNKHAWTRGPSAKIWNDKSSYYYDVMSNRPRLYYSGVRSHVPNEWMPSSNKLLHEMSKQATFNDEWMNHRGYRERRRIFEAIQNSASKYGINAKSCVLRIICEVKHFLLPRGKSLIQDIIRILFEIPTKSHWQDDYSRATRHGEDGCQQVYKNACPISILEFVLHNQVIISKI